MSAAATFALLSAGYVSATANGDRRREIRRPESGQFRQWQGVVPPSVLQALAQEARTKREGFVKILARDGAGHGVEAD
jgi:hypothetical protein